MVVNQSTVLQNNFIKIWLQINRQFCRETSLKYDCKSIEFCRETSFKYGCKSIDSFAKKLHLNMVANQLTVLQRNFIQIWLQINRQFFRETSFKYSCKSIDSFAEKLH